MRIFFLFLLTISLLFSSTIDTKIKQNKKQLSAKKIQYKKMDKQLSKIAKKILSAKKEQKTLSRKLSKLAINIKNNEAEFSRIQKQEKKLTSELHSVSSKIGKKEKKFLDLVAKNFSLALALDELKQPTPDSIMMKEAYELYAKKNSEEIAFLEKDISALKHKKSTLKSKKSHLQSAITSFENERKEFKVKKAKQDRLVKNLARDKAIYKKRFYKIKASRKNLERKLAKLRIIKRNKAEEAKNRDTVKSVEPMAQQTSHSAGVSETAPQIIATASSAKYTGSKTISPLKGARLIKKFGTYIDPIYKFKIFNKSITLKAPYAGSKVRSVLSGKVVFAENSGGMLGKVVIVEHSNGIHTIYAKLSRLAPGIHVGKRVLRASVIGKVDKSLMFEVTKNNKHMNPMKLIRL